MESVFIILNSACTKQCPYCFYNTGHQRKREELLSADPVMSFCTALKAKGLKIVILTGGEPLLFPELSGLIERLAKSGLYIILITNGDLLTNQKKKELRQRGLSSISVSLHIENNAEKELEEKMENISNGTNLPLTFIFPLTSKNFKLAGKAVTIAGKLEKGLILQPAFIPSHSKQYQLLSLRNFFNDKKELMANFGTELTQWATSFNSLEYAGLFLSLFSEKPQKPYFCPMGTDIVVLNCDGKVVPCFHRKDLSIGNIFNEDIKDIAAKIDMFSNTLSNAECFGEHCVSLFA